MIHMGQNSMLQIGKYWLGKGKLWVINLIGNKRDTVTHARIFIYFTEYSLIFHS